MDILQMNYEHIVFQAVTGHNSAQSTRGNL